MTEVGAGGGGNGAWCAPRRDTRGKRGYDGGGKRGYDGSRGGYLAEFCTEPRAASSLVPWPHPGTSGGAQAHVRGGGGNGAWCAAQRDTRGKRGYDGGGKRGYDGGGGGYLAEFCTEPRAASPLVPWSRPGTSGGAQACARGEAGTGLGAQRSEIPAASAGMTDLKSAGVAGGCAGVAAGACAAGGACAGVAGRACAQVRRLDARAGVAEVWAKSGGRCRTLGRGRRFLRRGLRRW